MAGRLRAPTGRYGGRTAEQRQAERRGRFLAAALQSFGGVPGYRGTTVASLSEAAGLSTRQFYEEFRTLEDVLAALHLQVNDWAEEAVLAAFAAAGDAPLVERVTAIFRAYAANVTADPRRVRITFVEIVGVSPRLEEQRLARRARWVDLICAEATAAAARGEAAPPGLPSRGDGLHRQRQRPPPRLEFGVGGRHAGRGGRRTGATTAGNPQTGRLGTRAPWRTGPAAHAVTEGAARAHRSARHSPGTPVALLHMPCSRGPFRVWSADAASGW
ncbi:AcrR family transcriptional regulator [Streptomyces sp. V3I8]|nr:AcrR family transcriptional regulator [Streptomyces sp. V3I8]